MRDSISVEDSMRVLNLDQVEDEESLRQAYYACIRAAHPDINKDADAVTRATQINLAYEALQQALQKGTLSKIRVTTNVFERTTADVSCVFVDPFVLGVDPFEWRALQAAVRGELSRDDCATPEEALQALQLPSIGRAVVYVTPEQLTALETLMEEMEATMQFDIAAWQVQTNLLRATRANARAPR